MATGIRDKVAILGMGCSKFGERWDKEADDLMERDGRAWRNVVGEEPGDKCSAATSGKPL